MQTWQQHTRLLHKTQRPRNGSSYGAITADLRLRLDQDHGLQDLDSPGRRRATGILWNMKLICWWCPTYKKMYREGKPAVPFHLNLLPGRSKAPVLQRVFRSRIISPLRTQYSHDQIDFGRKWNGGWINTSLNLSLTVTVGLLCGLKGGLWIYGAELDAW